MNLAKKIFKIILNILGICLIISGINALFAFIEERIHNSNVPEDGKVYMWKYGKIFYTKRGEGSPVILVHSLSPDHSGKNLTTLTQHLSLTHTVYTLDLLGFGLSDKPWITYTNFVYATLLKNFATDVVGGKASLVVCGDSGLFGMQANKIAPGVFDKVVLLNPAKVERIRIKKEVGICLKKLLDFPLIGTFLFNIYSLVGATPFDKEGRHVMASRLAGHLTVSINKKPSFMSSNVIILERQNGNNFTYGDISSVLLSEDFT